MPKGLLEVSIEQELIKSELNEAQHIEALETTDALAKVMEEFREATRHIRNDGRLTQAGQASDLAVLKTSTNGRITQIGDDRLESLDKRIAELEYLTRPQQPDTDPQLELLNQQKVRRMLAGVDELHLMEVYQELSVSGANDLIMRAIEQSPIPMINDPSILEAGKKARGERQNAESARTLRQLRKVRNTIAATVNAYRSELGLPDLTLETIAQAGVS